MYTSCDAGDKHISHTFDAILKIISVIQRISEANIKKI